jgi:DNA-binding MurR/RpiR family transcriptional regulator
MSTFLVTVRQLDAAPITFYAIGRNSSAVGEHAAARFDVCGVTVIPTRRG